MQTLLLPRPAVALCVRNREQVVLEFGKVAARDRPYRTGFGQVWIEQSGGYVTLGALQVWSAPPSNLAHEFPRAPAES